jgi:hypothetical protein
MTISKKKAHHTTGAGSLGQAARGGDRWNQHELFESFVVCTLQAVQDWEVFFRVNGLAGQVFGRAVDSEGFTTHALRESAAWNTLMSLFDYATEGVTDGMEEMSIVLDAASILSLIRTESHFPSAQWEDILSMGDARYALDSGSPLTLDRIALLANVDIRTVRNAVSAGDLSVDKGSVDNSEARRWLHGRKGFKPTVFTNSAENLALETVHTAADLGAILKKQRERIGLADIEHKVELVHPLADSATLKELEAGVFQLPLNAVFCIADVYQLSRRSLLECVMRVFYPAEMETLRQSLN